MKRNVKTLIAGTAIALSLGLMNAAHAMNEPSASFYPVASWDVSTIQDTAANTPHCLIMNEYNNGFFLQLQGSAGNIEAMSIDFRQNAFAVGQNETVSLRIPGQPVKTLSATAFSADVLSVNMAGQDAFFQAMRGANALDIQVGDSAFRFFLTGFANSMAAYDACLKPGAAVQPTMASAAPEPQEEMVTENVNEITEDDVEVVSASEMQPAPENVSTSEPERTAPSKLMNERSAKAQEQYAKELSVILQEPEERVSAELQKALAEQERSIADEKALNMRPQPGKRYTQQLAEQMGTPTDRVPPMDAQIEPTTPVNDTAALIEPETEIIEEPAMIETEEVIQTPAEQTAMSTDTAEDIIWNAPPSSTKVEVVETAPPPAESLDAPEEENSSDLVEDLEDFVGSDEPQTNTAAMAPETQPEMNDDTLLPPVENRAKMEEPTPMPKTISASTPEMKVTRETYSSEVDFTDGGLPTREIERAPARMPIADNSEELEKMQRKINRLQSENAALNSELETALRSGEKERLEIASDNWNLEEATMKYNEAERQIAKLGQQIQKERAQFEYEKKELEMMLFDPQVTEEAQLARLASLEKKIQKLEQELLLQEEQYERQIQMLKSQRSQ